MFHGTISACALADQLCARFNDRQHRTRIERHGDSAVVQIGSPHGTPLTLHMADLSGGVLVTMSRGRDWLDQAGDAAQMIERAARSPFSMLALLPDLVGEMRKDNLPRRVWEAVNDLMALSRALAGEKGAPANPKVCLHCHTANDPALELCSSCGAPLPVQLPRACPKCARQHTSDALFCQACGTRLVSE
jgi:RNA polymerase subunit RPABC4/transcription elongation factor Spt4